MVQYNTLRHKSQVVFDALRKIYYHQFRLIFCAFKSGFRKYQFILH
jgi:hypothetical protein